MTKLDDVQCLYFAECEKTWDKGLSKWAREKASHKADGIRAAANAVWPDNFIGMNADLHIMDTIPGAELMCLGQCLIIEEADDD